jgi:hypothetical protein
VRGVRGSAIAAVASATVVDLLLDGSHRLLVVLSVLEQEGKLLESAAAGLGVQEVDDGKLKGDPAAVDGEVAPLDGVEGNRVDVGREETGELAKDLLHTDTTAAVGVGPELDKVGC